MKRDARSRTSPLPDASLGVAGAQRPHRGLSAKAKATMVASRPTVMAPPRTSAAPRAFLAQWRARPHRRLVGVSVVCVESHEGRRIRAREAHQRLHAAFRDLDTDGALVTRTWAPAIDPEPVVTSVLNPPREERASGRTLGTRGGPKSQTEPFIFTRFLRVFGFTNPRFASPRLSKLFFLRKPSLFWDSTFRPFGTTA